jgi:outer membrane protein assembly factor BamB
VTNESGISINGDDYAGYHTFSADGSRVVYGDMSGQPSPHVTNVLRSRDTTTGELLWSAELDRPVTVTHWYGDRIVALAPSGGVPGATYEAVIVLDALTGDVITTVPTSLDIAFVG